MGDKLLKAVIAVITLVWAANFAAPLWNPEYKPSPELNAAFMTVVGGIILARSHKTEREDEDPPTPAAPPPPAREPEDELPTGADPR